MSIHQQALIPADPARVYAVLADASALSALSGKTGRAAVAGEEFSAFDGNVTGRYSFKGSPYVGDNLKDYRAQSPITYWSSIKTPTLLLHDTGDARVTITQSYSLFHALKDNGVEVKFFAYPVGGHFPPG